MKVYVHSHVRVYMQSTLHVLKEDVHAVFSCRYFEMISLDEHAEYQREVSCHSVQNKIQRLSSIAVGRNVLLHNLKVKFENMNAHMIKEANKCADISLISQNMDQNVEKYFNYYVRFQTKLLVSICFRLVGLLFIFKIGFLRQWS